MLPASWQEGGGRCALRKPAGGGRGGNAFPLPFRVPAHGTREMPVWGRILGEKIAEGTSEEEVARGRIDALVAYLISIQE